MFVVGSMPNAGSSFTNYLLGPLKFTDLEYMVVGLVGIVCSTIGIFMYVGRVVCGVMVLWCYGVMWIFMWIMLFLIYDTQTMKRLGGLALVLELIIFQPFNCLIVLIVVVVLCVDAGINGGFGT